jgi:hypothetical protein
MPFLRNLIKIYINPIKPVTFKRYAEKLDLPNNFSVDHLTPNRIGIPSVISN